jgi:hypothetical protein
MENAKNALVILEEQSKLAAESQFVTSCQVITNKQHTSSQKKLTKSDF